MTTEKFHFGGRVGRANANAGRVRDAVHRQADIWHYEADDFAIGVCGEHALTVAAWQDPAERLARPSVFVAGSLYLGSDREYGESTSVKPLSIESAPEVIARCFELHGTRAFALLDGDFSLVVCDPKSKSVYLVVDKLGCGDIYLRREGNSLLFASQPSDLIDDDGQFAPLPVAFLLAHEGFIPAPFTLSEDVNAIGRSRFARVSMSAGKVRCDIETYWSPGEQWKLPSTATSRGKLFALLKDAVGVRMGRKSSILLSGGIDSSLIMNLATCRRDGNLLALTGSVKGWDQGEQEIVHARSIAEDFGVPHESVVLDPQDDTLPEESFRCSATWMNGIRLALPLWRRFALRLREHLGEGYNVLAGQTADTLVDNNYTLPSAGYTLRRTFFSSWFLRTMPLWKALFPRTDGTLGMALIACVNSLGGPRMAGMVRSVLDGMSRREVFYAGRLFGHGEMPGVSRAYFPMLSAKGFDRVVDWYSSNFIRPLVQNLDSRNFYRQMIQMSLDMNMLHLDSRLLFHAYRQEGGRAQLPFMDARVVTFFSNLPYSARAFYREPKHIIRCQLRRDGMRYRPKPFGKGNSRPRKSQEQLLLEGTLGAYYRELLRESTLPNRTPGLFEFVDEQYFEKQVAAFRKTEKEIDYRFISKIGTLEVWGRALSSRSKEESALATTNQA
jgi:asparagine synthetase B (glutamine-hydrolysing)